LSLSAGPSECGGYGSNDISEAIHSEHMFDATTMKERLEAWAVARVLKMFFSVAIYA
jgi:hypothetical protein